MPIKQTGIYFKGARAPFKQGLRLILGLNQCHCRQTCLTPTQNKCTASVMNTEAFTLDQNQTQPRSMKAI